MNNFYFKGFFCSILIGGTCLTASAQEAQIDATVYETLAEAIAAANENETVTLLTDATVSTVIPVTKSLTLDLNGKTITNNVTENRLFRLSGVNFTIVGNDGKVIIPETNTDSYGFVDFRDANGAASASTSFTASNVNFEGATNDGSLFAFRTNGQSIDFDNVNVNLTGGNTYSIINGYKTAVNIKVSGGEFICNSTNITAGAFQAGVGSEIEFNNVTVNSSVGPIFEVIASNATFTDCTMTNTATYSYYASCLAASNGGNVTVIGGEYTANYPIYVYNSGGTFNVEGGTFNGNVAAIKVDNTETASYSSVVNITDGTFIGALNADNRSEIKVNESSEKVEVVDANGKPSYVVLPENSDVVALAGITKYSSLADAFAATEDGEIITLCKDTAVDEMIPVTKSVILNINGKTITNNVTENRLFRLSGVNFTIEGNDGKVIIPETNTNSYGFVDFRDASGAASASTSFTASNINFEGATNDGSLFAFRANGQSIDFDNVNVNLTGGNTYSIINGYQLAVNIKVSGGEFICNSTNITAGAFQAGVGSEIEFNNVNVNSSVGPIFEVIASNATFTDCTMTNTATNSYFASCLAVSNGGNVTVNGGEYTANYPIYVYNSGGTFNVEGGTFNGNVAAIKIDNTTTEAKSRVEVTDGTFKGNVQVGNESELVLNGGNYTDSTAKQYCANGFTLSDEPNEDGSFAVIPDDNTTAIDEIIITPAATSGKIYNLQGICVGENIESLTPGIYIVNGTKIAIQ